MTDLSWQIPLTVFIIVTVWRAVCSPYWIHQEQEKKLSQCLYTVQNLQSSSVEIIYDPTQLVYSMPRGDDTWRRFRIGIRNKHATAIHNVRVKVISITPASMDSDQALPCLIKPAHQTSSCFSINANDTELMNVGTGEPQRTYGLSVIKPCFYLCQSVGFHEGRFTISLLDKPYVMTIKVTAEQGIVDTKTFELGMKDSEFFMELKSEASVCHAGNI